MATGAWLQSSFLADYPVGDVWRDRWRRVFDIVAGDQSGQIGSNVHVSGLLIDIYSLFSSAGSTSPILRCAMTSVSRLDNLSRRREVSYWSMSFNLTSDRCLQSGIISTIFLILLGIFCCWPLQSPGYLLTSAVTRWSVLEFFFFGNTYLYFIWQLQSGGHLGICRHFYHLAPSQSS